MNVAAYCRVSTDREDQSNSLENQQLFFYEFITRNPQWRLVKIYSDEGVSGTSVTKRAGFNEMIATAKSGGIDLIITKEVSRFARNTVDTLNYTRELRRHNVGVYFINDNINTLDNDGEFRLSIMASVAQEESRKISSRVKWGMDKMMERGHAFTPPIIGYDYNNGDLIINEEEAKIVRRIYHMYVNEGMGTTLIAQTLAKENVPLCKRIRCWSPTLIMRIIKNEKYVGDLISKKTITVDYLTHRVVWNDGIEDKYVFKDHHKPIVSREIWDKAQEICSNRYNENTASAARHKNACRYWCSGKLFCSECGGSFVSKAKNVQYGTLRYYRCKHTTHYKNETGSCPNGAYVDERALRACVQFAITKLSINRDDVLGTLKKAMTNLSQGTEENFSGEKEIEKIEQKKKKLLELLLEGAISKQDYQTMADSLNHDIAKIYKKMDEFKKEIESRQNIENQIETVLKKADEYLSQKEETPQLYSKIVDKIIIYPDHHVDIYISGIDVKYSVIYQKINRGSSYQAVCRDYIPQTENKK